MEYRAAKDSGITVVAKKEDGTVEKVTADEIKIRNKKGDVTTYKLRKVQKNKWWNMY